MSRNSRPEDTGTPLKVGGQAVLEGVMMRSPWRVATAVRTQAGSIRVRSYPFVSASKRHRLIGLPVIRGAVGLFEAMAIGVRSLNWSADVAAEEDEGARKPGFWDHVLSLLATLVAFAAGIGLFMAVPYAVAGLLPRAENQVLFHLVAGSLRVLLLIGYMFAISLVPDIKRVFRYHGAEHKSIFAFERGEALEVGPACRQSRFHPRCGTSFLLLAAVLTMIGFMIFDTLWVAFVGSFDTLFHRIGIHLLMIPLVVGLSYELLRLVEEHAEDPKWQPLVKPGFWLQGITTREPDEKQVEVALASLHEALRKDDEAYEGEPRHDAEEEKHTAESDREAATATVA